MPQNEELTFTLSQAEFSRAHRLHLRRALLNVKTIGLAAIAMFIIAGQAQVLGPASWAAPFFLLLWGAIFAALFFAFISLPGHLYRQNPGWSGPQKLLLDSRRLALQLGDEELTYDWNSLIRVRENEEFLLLYFKPPLPVVIPKKALHGGVDEFKDRVHSLASDAT